MFDRAIRDREQDIYDLLEIVDDCHEDIERCDFCRRLFGSRYLRTTGHDDELWICENCSASDDEN